MLSDFDLFLEELLNYLEAACQAVISTAPPLFLRAIESVRL